MINFILPGMYELKDLNLKFLQIFRDKPEYFYDNVNIYGVYGNFQFCILDGGRIFNNYTHCSTEEIETILEAYNKDFKVPIRLVFTNTCVKPEHYTDRFSNIVLKLCENNFNEIVINNSGLENYIKEFYPSYGFISSTTKCLNKKEDFKEELSKDYKMICLDYNLNHNFNLLESLTEEEKNKCEFLVNPICPPGCPNRKEHYKLNSLFHLNYGKNYTMTSCGIKQSLVHPNTCKQSNFISPDEIFNYYSKQGFSYYKLEGRTLDTISVGVNYVKYMVKPEYQNEVLFLLHFGSSKLTF